MKIAFSHYREPEGDDFVLAVPPRLESWDAKTAPSQVRLAAYLKYVAELARERLGELGDTPLALELKVALPHGVALTAGHDLDNYLYPLARCFGHRRVASAWASKSRGFAASALRIGPAAPSEPPQTADGWSFASAETTVSTSTAAWKHQIAERLWPLVSLAPDGPVEVQLAFAVSARRNWAWLWKPALDALGAIWGLDDIAKPFQTRDDRITRLAAHRTVDQSLGNRVLLGVWWRSA